MRNKAKKKKGPIDSLSRNWKKAGKKNTHKKSRQMAQQQIKEKRNNG